MDSSRSTGRRAEGLGKFVQSRERVLTGTIKRV